MNIQQAVDIFYNNKDLPGSLRALYSIGKLWHLDDEPSDCGFDDEEAKILSEYQLAVWNYCFANGIDPFEYYPKEIMDC